MKIRRVVGGGVESSGSCGSTWIQRLVVAFCVALIIVMIDFLPQMGEDGAVLAVLESLDPSRPSALKSAKYATNEENLQRNASGKQQDQNPSQSIMSRSIAGSQYHVPSVEIAEGANKYVLILATSYDGTDQYFVTSRRGASYHRHAAKPKIRQLETAGYFNIRVMGGGRIVLDDKKISIYGYSNRYGRADHEISQKVVLEDPRYTDFEVTISNEGY